MAGYDADRLDLHQRRRRRVRRGLGHPRGGRPAGHLLDHQRRPAGQPHHREGRRQRRRRHGDGRRLRDHHRRRRRSSSAPPVEDPTDTFTYTAATLVVAPGTYTLAELEVAGYAPTAWTCTNGDGGAFDAGIGHPRGGRRRRSPARSPTTTSRSASIIEKVVVNDDGGTAVVDDFGITTDAGDARVRRRRRGPHRHVHLHRRDPRGRARHVHPRRARGGRLRADRLDLHQR